MLPISSRLKQAGFSLSLFVLITLSGCVPDNLTEYDFKELQPPSTLPEEKGNVKVGEQNLAGVNVALYIDRGPHTGYNRINVMLTDATGTTLSDADIELTPAYTVEGKSMAVPFTNPANRANDEGFFEGSALFLPPAEFAGSFSLAIDVNIADIELGQAVFPLEVEESLWMQRVDTDNGRYYVSWVHPARPEVGQNEFEVDIRQETKAGYVPINTATIDLYPYMDMGGGEGHSTPYQAPQFTNEGRYRGTVDFIMAGGWEMTVYVTRENTPIESVRFEDYIVR